MSPSEKEAAEPVRYRNQATQRVLSVLTAFASHLHSRGVSEIARELGMNKNMAYRALGTLTAEGYLTRDSSGERYELGPRLFAYAVGTGNESDIVALSRPVLEQLHQLTGESVYLSIVVGRNRVTVDDIQGQGARVLRSQRGSPVPLHCTKMSRMLLAHLSDREIAEYLSAAAPLPRPNLIPDPQSETTAGVWEDVHAIRAVPYLLWRNPHHASAAYAIFPIQDSAGRPHAVVTIGGPRERFDLTEIEAALPRMRRILEPLEQEARLFPAPPFLVDA